MKGSTVAMNGSDLCWGSLCSERSNEQECCTLKTYIKKKKGAEDPNRYFSKENIQMANMCMKRRSALPIIRQTQVRSTMRCHLTPTGWL